MALAKESAERNAKKSAGMTEENQQRLAMAETSMRKMLVSVNKETKNVEEAIEDLKQVQMDSEGGVDSQLIDLKSGGVVKQATLVGALLFSLRSVADGVAYMGGDATHLMPAEIQAAIAVACLVAFLFL
jgi:ribosomal protein S20